jgi:tripartite-type tricarboxylate transporter receptor subunit TctC
MSMKFVILKSIVAVFLTTLLVPVAISAEVIKVVWGFNPGSNQANTLRQLIDVANQKQSEFRFVFTSHPGAGGYIAAREVSNNPQNTVVSMSSSFIIRPLFERTNAVHNLDEYVPVLVQAHGAPLYIVSSKYTDIREVNAATDINIGVSGIGSISHMVANELIKLNPRAQIINYKSGLDAVNAAAGGHVDVAVSFYADSKGLVDSNKIKILIRTGVETIPDSVLTLSQLGFDSAKYLTANYAIFASRHMENNRLQKIHAILGDAQKNQIVRDMYVKDQLIQLDLNLSQSKSWYNSQRAYWKEIVDKVQQ